MSQKKQSKHPTRLIERKAMKVVMEYEKTANANPTDVSSHGCGYDIESRGRLIEVKGFSNIRYPVISLWGNLKKRLAHNKEKYYIYIVYDIGRKPKLKVIKPDVIWKNIEPEKKYILRGKHYRPIQDEPL